MNSYIYTLGKKAKTASLELKESSLSDRNKVLSCLADTLEYKKKDIIETNKIDLESGKQRGLNDAMLDRLKLDEKRISSMVDGLKSMIAFPDPLHQSLDGWRHENGMVISKISVPLGVIGMIYESRPNVTIDVSALAIKSGNCVILRGGSEALHTNVYLRKLVADALEVVGYSRDCVQLIENTDRRLVSDFIKMNDYLDVLIPRGGKGLKQAIIKEATVPVIETGQGICHVYVDQYADNNMAKDIIMNAKTQRTGVCNAIETLLVHESVASLLLGELDKLLDQKQYELLACKRGLNFMPHAVLADDSAWSTEYLDTKLSIKIVDSLDDAISHINTYGTGHSESIVTNNNQNTEKFLNQVDASVVYVNASTRFTDGDVFGFGGEVGISTQKLHARGPMGIKALTTYKYTVRGQGQIRQ